MLGLLAQLVVNLFVDFLFQALIFLEEKGFPSHGHVHSGNIVVENNKCR